MQMIFDHESLVKLAEALEKHKERIKISPDLGLSEVEIDLSELEPLHEQLEPILKKDRGLFTLTEGRLKHLALYDEGFYQLVATGEAPTVEIDGIQMHRTKDIKPFEDARQKVKTVIKKGDAVLDTCGGLGYTAIWAVRMGALNVVSCEPNKNIRYLRGQNPWSDEFVGERIKSREIRVEEFLEDCEDEWFDCILHDPPRFSLAGELYSAEFYQRLADILRPKGRLFHYTGNPYSHGRPRMFIEGIMRRLTEAGFKVKRRDDVLGVVGVKR
jgi:predicted methyltransferase